LMSSDSAEMGQKPTPHSNANINRPKVQAVSLP
jgi:hypothetical protein